jgi:hypothetical protein
MKHLIVLFAVAVTALADPIIVVTGVGATVTDLATNTTLPVAAEASFTINADSSVTLRIVNNITNPTGVLQNISDLYFDVYTVDGLYTGPGMITGLTGSTVTVGDQGAFTTAPISSLPANSWTMAFESGANAFHLNALGTGQPQYTIIGAPDGSNYSNNGGFRNGPHNPFLQSGAEFTLTFDNAPVSGIDNVVFSFGSAPGITSAGEIVNETPEPATLGMIGTAVVGLSMVLRRFRRSSC